MIAYQNLVLTTTATERSLDDQLSRLISVRWLIGTQVVLDVTGPDLITILRMNSKLYDQVTKMVI